MAKSSDRVVANAAEVSPITVMYRREIVQTLLFGFVVGVVFAGAYYLLDKFVFGSVLCRPGNDIACSSAPTYAMAVAVVLSSLVGLIGLVQLRGYRPLMVVLAIAVSFWGAQVLLAGVSWYLGVIAMGILLALSYLLFSWIARLRSVSIVLVAMIVLVIAIRLALVS